MGTVVEYIDVCICEEGYEWDLGMKVCVSNCRMTFATGRVANQENICTCQSGYEWNGGEETCVNSSDEEICATYAVKCAREGPSQGIIFGIAFGAGGLVLLSVLIFLIYRYINLHNKVHSNNEEEE